MEQVIINFLHVQLLFTNCEHLLLIGAVFTDKMKLLSGFFLQKT